MKLRVTFCDPNADVQPWLDGLRAQLAGASVQAWTPAAELADYGVAWAPPQAFLDQQTALKALFNIGAGVDRLLAMRLPRGLKVVRLEDAGMATQMAEYVCHAVSRHFRGFDLYADQAARALWAPRRPPRSRSQFAVGILGLGVLGQRVASALRQFEFPLNGWSRSARAIDGMRGFTGRAQLGDFMAASQVLVNLLPLTPDTRDILCRDTLSRLPRGAYVVNVARGAHLVDDDLLALLDSGHLAGATLDVFRTEPLPPQHAFWRHPAIHVTPHISAQTLRDESITQIAAKIMAFERGEPVTGMVDLEHGY